MRDRFRLLDDPSPAVPERVDRMTVQSGPDRAAWQVAYGNVPDPSVQLVEVDESGWSTLRE